MMMLMVVKFLFDENIEGQDCGWNKFIINHGIIQSRFGSIVDDVSCPETTCDGNGNSGRWFLQFQSNERWHVISMTPVWKHVSWPFSSWCSLDFSRIFHIDHFIPSTLYPRSFELICVPIVCNETWETKNKEEEKEREQSQSVIKTWVRKVDHVREKTFSLWTSNSLITLEWIQQNHQSKWI